MRTFSIVGWILFFCSVANAQQFAIIKSIETTANFFTTDRLGNAYTIEQNEIKKYDGDGIFQFAYNYNDLGTLNYLDATDPFKIMLFQPEFLKIRTLDSRLNTIGEINLSLFNDLGLPRLACVTDDGMYWIYDQQNQRLIKIDQKGTVLLTGNSFNQLIDQALNPKLLVATDTWLMLRNADSTVYIFDRFGNYFRKLPFIGTPGLQANGNQILYLMENKFFTIDVNTGKEMPVATPDLYGVSVVRIEQHRLYLKKEGLLEIYSF